MSVTSYVIKNVVPITGDGSAPGAAADILIVDGRVESIAPSSSTNFEVSADRIIDGTGYYAIPGLINIHTHGVTPGPLFPSGAKPLSEKEWKDNLHRHLHYATTTVLNTCSFATMEDVATANEANIINVVGATGRFAGAVSAANRIDGLGLRSGIDYTDIEAEEVAGAAAYGEIGAGHTLGGAGQDYMYIPQAVEQACGIRPDTTLSRELKYAVLGRELDASFDYDRVQSVISGTPLEGVLDAEQVNEIVRNCVLPSVHDALASYDEAAARSAVTGLPALFHSAAPSAKRLIEIAEKYAGTQAVLIAGHSNHPSFELDEAIELARRLKSLGVLIEISTLDSFEHRVLAADAEMFDALIDEGLVDFIATDYAGSHWEPILMSLEHLRSRPGVELGKLIALTSGNAHRYLPSIAGERGLLQVGSPADLALVAIDDLTQVSTVFVDGTVRYSVDNDQNTTRTQ